jgi:hypothetical protein
MSIQRRRKNPKKSKKSDKNEEEDSGKEKKQKKKRRKEKSKNEDADPDQETVESANNNNNSEKKKKKKKKKKKPEPAEPVEVAEDVPAESERKKKKKKKSKANKDDEDDDTNTNAKTDTADEMSETNIASKRGKYSKAENQLLEAKIFEVINAKGWDRDEGLEKICNGKLKEREGVWIEIAGVLPDREWRSVASHCRRVFNPDHYKGNWTDAEEIQLRALVQEHKSAWRKIGTELGRLPTACRDKWRDIKNEDGYVSGVWSAEEDEKLLAALKTMNKGQLPNDDSAPILWSKITEVLGSRNQDACRARWRKLDPTKQKSRIEWSDEDSKKLLVKVYNMHPQDESEITFSQLSKKWIYKVIQIRWKVLLKYAPDNQNKTLPENLKALVKHFDLKKKDIKKIAEQIEEEGW